MTKKKKEEEEMQHFTAVKKSKSYTFYDRHKKWRGYYPKFWVCVRPSVRQRFHLCPLHNSDTVRDIFTKPLKL